MRYSTKLIEHIKFESVCNGIIVPRITNPAERGIDEENINVTIDNLQINYKLSKRN